MLPPLPSRKRKRRKETMEIVFFAVRLKRSEVRADVHIERVEDTASRGERWKQWQVVLSTRKRAFGTKESSSRELSCTFIRIDKRISRAIQKKRTLNNVHFPMAEVVEVVAIFIYGHSISTLYRLDSVKLDNYWFSTLTQLDNVRTQQQ